MKFRLVELTRVKGIAQIPLIIGLLLMAIAIPVATRLSQQEQDTRDMAAVAPSCSGVSAGSSCCTDCTAACCNNQMFACAGGTWTMVQSCSAGCKTDRSGCNASCAFSFTNCKACGDGCAANEKSCYVTNNDCTKAWKCLNFSSQCVVNPTTPPSVDCGSHPNHSNWCEGDRRAYCSSGTVYYETCSYGCNVGSGNCNSPPASTATPICSPNSLRCREELNGGKGAQERCNPLGTGWDVIMNCVTGCNGNLCDTYVTNTPIPTITPRNTATPTPISFTCVLPNVCRDTGGGRANCASYGMTTVLNKTCQSGYVCCASSKPTPAPTKHPSTSSMVVRDVNLFSFIKEAKAQSSYDCTDIQINTEGTCNYRQYNRFYSWDCLTVGRLCSSNPNVSTSCDTDKARQGYTTCGSDGKAYACTMGKDSNNNSYTYWTVQDCAPAGICQDGMCVVPNCSAGGEFCSYLYTGLWGWDNCLHCCYGVEIDGAVFRCKEHKEGVEPNCNQPGEVCSILGSGFIFGNCLHCCYGYHVDNWGVFRCKESPAYVSPRPTATPINECVGSGGECIGVFEICESGQYGQGCPIPKRCCIVSTPIPTSTPRSGTDIYCRGLSTEINCRQYSECDWKAGIGCREKLVVTSTPTPRSGTDIYCAGFTYEINCRQYSECDWIDGRCREKLAPTSTALPTAKPTIPHTPGATSIPNITPQPTTQVTPVPTSTNAPPPGPTNPPTPPTNCSYDSLQARVQPDTTIDWNTQLTLAGGQKVNLGCMHDGSGQLAENVMIVAEHSSGAKNEFNQNLVDQWTPPRPGNYTVWCESTDTNCAGLVSSTNATLSVGSACKECPNDFHCYGPVDDRAQELGYAWFATGYVMEGWVAQVPDNYCTDYGGLVKPQWLGKGMGDANCDGQINTYDFTLWNTEFEVSEGGEVSSDNWETDYTGPQGVCDGLVNTYDFSLWNRSYVQLEGGDN